MIHRLPPAHMAGLAETVELQRAGCELAGSDLYARLLAVVADDLRAGGPSLDLLGPYAVAPVGDAVLLRLLAGVHALVLDGRVPELEAHYPSVRCRSDLDPSVSVAGAPGARGPSPSGPSRSRSSDPDLAVSFVDALHRFAPELEAALRRGVQTNEIGRSAALLCGYLEVADTGMPLRILEVGASAGLNLNFDRYRYVSGGWSYGPPDSPVLFEDPYRGRPPRSSAPVHVAERRGCDLDPVDASSPEGRLRLRSFVWPDQLDRMARLEAALAVAVDHPVPVDRVDGVSWLAENLARRSDGVVTVVTHSIVFQYLSSGDRSRFLEVLDEAGARASASAPLAWLRMEPGGGTAEVRLTRWPGGGTHLVARSGYHGPVVAPVLRSRSFTGR